MDKIVCIIHFNTPTLTERLVESINKHTQDAKIFIFDNSDKKPFTKEYENVKVFDNTKGQIINFEKWLRKYPRRNLSGGKANKWGSAKHAYSVEKCMELIGEPFVLLDSDVLIKNDISILYREDVCYVGEVVNQPSSKIKRVIPFVCFINTPLCIKKKIHYFDERYMHGLHVGNFGDSYDTGAALYLLTEKYKGKHWEIKAGDFVVHYGSGSWVAAKEKMKKKAHIPEREWLNKYKKLWDMTLSDMKGKTTFSDVFDHIYCLHNLPDEERLPKLKEELRRVGIDENAPYFSWKYDFPSETLDCLFSDKRINMDLVLRASGRPYIKKASMRHYEIIKEAYALGYERILILENDIRFHKDLDYIVKMLENIPDTDIVLFDKMVSSSYKDAIKYRERVRNLEEGALYGDMDGIFFIFASCYALNRYGMEHIIEKQEESLLPPDTPFNDKEITGSFAVVNLAIQDPELKDKKNESYDKIGLDVKKYGSEKEVEAVETKKPETAKPKPATTKTITGRTLERPPKTIRPKKTENTKILATHKPTSKPKVKEPIKILERRKKFNFDKATHVHTRTLYAEKKGHNKLYDLMS